MRGNRVDVALILEASQKNKAKYILDLYQRIGVMLERGELEAVQKRIMELAIRCWCTVGWRGDGFICPTWDGYQLVQVKDGRFHSLEEDYQ